MPKQPPTTPESDVPITERLKRVVGAGMRGRDIQLPQEGKRDPRLGPSPEEQRENLRQGIATVRGLMKKTSTRAARRSTTRRA